MQSPNKSSNEIDGPASVLWLVLLTLVVVELPSIMFKAVTVGWDERLLVIQIIWLVCAGIIIWTAGQRVTDRN